MNYTDRIFPTNKGLTTYLDELVGKNYQIPTFQRYVVWQQENVFAHRRKRPADKTAAESGGEEEEPK